MVFHGPRCPESVKTKRCAFAWRANFTLEVLLDIRYATSVDDCVPCSGFMTLHADMTRLIGTAILERAPQPTIRRASMQIVRRIIGPTATEIHLQPDMLCHGLVSHLTAQRCRPPSTVAAIPRYRSSLASTEDKSSTRQSVVSSEVISSTKDSKISGPTPYHF